MASDICEPISQGTALDAKGRNRPTGPDPRDRLNARTFSDVALSDASRPDWARRELGHRVTVPCFGGTDCRCVTVHRGRSAFVGDCGTKQEEGSVEVAAGWPRSRATSPTGLDRGVCDLPAPRGWHKHGGGCRRFCWCGRCEGVGHNVPAERAEGFSAQSQRSYRRYRDDLQRGKHPGTGDDRAPWS
jgi:hypothetical protein